MPFDCLDMQSLTEEPDAEYMTYSMMQPATSFNQTTLKDASGRGLLLRNIDRDASVSIAYGIIQKSDYEANVTATARDIIAVC